MTIERVTVGELLESVAARQPTPGGGAVAALAAGLAAALGEMVLRYTVGRPGAHPEAHTEAHQEALGTLARMRSASPRLADDDMEAFGRQSALWKLAPGDQRRRREFPGAVEAAIAAPRRVMDAAIEILQALHQVRQSAGRNLRSDLAIAALMAQAAAEAAAWNVRVNLPLVEDRAAAARLQQQVAAELGQAAALRAAIEAACSG